MSSLSLNDINELLGITPKPRQAGPLRYNTNKYGNCRNCGVITCLTVEGHYYCSSHGLYALNCAALGLAIKNDCNCDVGRKTMFSLHTHDCAVYDRLSE